MVEKDGKATYHYYRELGLAQAKSGKYSDALLAFAHAVSADRRNDLKVYVDRDMDQAIKTMAQNLRPAILTITGLSEESLCKALPGGEEDVNSRLRVAHVVSVINNGGHIQFLLCLLREKSQALEHILISTEKNQLFLWLLIILSFFPAKNA